MPIFKAFNRLRDVVYESLPFHQIPTFTGRYRATGALLVALGVIPPGNTQSPYSQERRRERRYQSGGFPWAAFTKSHRGGLVVPSMDERLSTGPLHLGSSGRKLFRTFTKTVRGLSPGTRPRAIRQRADRAITGNSPASSRSPALLLFFTAKARAAGERVWPPEARAGAAFGSHNACPWRDTPRQRRG